MADLWQHLERYIQNAFDPSLIGQTGKYCRAVGDQPSITTPLVKLPAVRCCFGPPKTWAGQRKAEKDGRPPGSSEGLMTEAVEKPTVNRGRPPLSPGSVDSITGPVHLAELLLAPADVRKVIAGLDKAVSDSREVAEQTKAAQRDLAKLRKDLEIERAKHEVTLDRERAEHKSAMARELAEVEAIKNAALELKAKAEADAAAAKWIKDDLMRRVKPLSPVVAG